jgi:hypothetical protein
VFAAGADFNPVGNLASLTPANSVFLDELLAVRGR